MERVRDKVWLIKVSGLQKRNMENRVLFVVRTFQG